VDGDKVSREAAGGLSSDVLSLRAAEALGETSELLRRLSEEKADWIAEVSRVLVECFRSGGKVLCCGNGGSASQADHAASELAGKYYMNRRALPAISLVDNPACVTAVANDLGYESLFARQIEGLGRSGDVLLAFTTSGSSPNIVLAVEKAGEMGITTVGFTGERGGEFAKLCDYCVVVPSRDTPRIQEIHLAFAHNICALTEAVLFSEG